MTYKDILTSAMTMVGHHPKTFLLGYNTSRIGGFCGGTASGFPEDRIAEMPLAENVMAGVAIGMSLEGYIPVLWLERMDFLTNCMDALVNHLDKLALLSNGLHRPAVIIRCAVGNKTKPLYTGPTHTQDFSLAMKQLVTFPVINLHWPSGIVGAYAKALADAQEGRSTMLVEYRDEMDTVV